MLQAREIACIFLLLAGFMLAGGALAQNPEDRDPAPDFKRIGAEPVENEPVLDLSLPQPEQKPETAEQRAERQRRERQAVIDVPIRADIPIKFAVTVPIDRQIPVQTEIPVNIPISQTVTVAVDRLIPVELEVPVTIPIEAELTVPVSRTIPIQVDVPVVMDVPVDIPLSETPLGDYLRGLSESLRQMAAE